MVLAVVLLIFVSAIAEIVLRLPELQDVRINPLSDARCAGATTFLSSQKGVFVLDDGAGYVTRPLTCLRLESPEFDQLMRTNNHGLPGPDVSDVKPAGEFRIVVLGDSYTAGGQWPYDQDFTAVLEQRLRQDGYTSVRVVNVGVGGWTTFNEAGYLRENLSWLQPDLVVIAAFLGNDVGENALATAGGYRLLLDHPKGFGYGQAAADLLQQSFAWFPRNGGAAAPAARTWNAGDPLPTPVGNQPPGNAYGRPPGAPPPTVGTQVRGVARAIWDGARTNSRLLGHFFGAPIDASVTTAPGAQPVSAQQEKIDIASFEWLILKDRPRQYWLDVAWPLFGKYLSDARAAADSVGAPALVVSIPQMAQFDDEMRSRTMESFRFDDAEVDWDRPQRDLKAQADAAGLPMLNLLPAFRARPDRADLYLRLDTHFTPLGHQVTAEQLAAYLEQGSWLAKAKG